MNCNKCVESLRFCRPAVPLLALFLLLFLPQHLLAQALGRTNPNSGLFPDSSMVDFRFLLDAPAGKHGFLRVDKNGHFAWSNGQRVRFWGLNIANRSVFLSSRESVDKVVDVLARSGTNLVRFEALDSYGGLLDTEGSDTTRVIDPQKLEILDYWVAKCRERGIYYYLDLLDFRQFKAGDEVAAYDKIGRAAKPYAFFDRRLIELQKEFARQLLTHKNPLTGLRYVDDPAFALSEICNEHGLFFKADKLDDLVEPYGLNFRQLWNQWLMRQYGSRDGIRQAWGRVNGVDVLGEDEEPANYAVRLPLFTPAPPPLPTDTLNPNAPPQVVDVRRAPKRLRDGVRFLYDVQRDYCREMKRYLRELGLKIPITAVVSNEYLPDVASVAAELDFTSENYYADHPAFAGKEWEGAFFHNDANPLRGSTLYQIAPWLAGLRWNNKPVVIREWATVWPNRFRCVGVPEMAAYAAMQDFDAVLLFGYLLHPKPETLSDFDHQADPPVWGLYSLGALAFQRGDIQPAHQTATITYTPETLFKWPCYLGTLHRLAWFVRLNSRLEGEVRTEDPAARPAAEGTRPASELIVRPGDSLPDSLMRFALSGAPLSPTALSTGVLASVTGQIVRKTTDGRLTLVTPCTVAVCGELPINRPITVGNWTLTTPTPIGALMVVSLDGQPLATTHRFVVKMVSRAANTGQALEAMPPAAPGRPKPPGKFRIKNRGTAPIVTFGRASTIPMRLERRLGKTSETVCTLAQVDGTWELVVQNGTATLASDTANIRGTLYGRAITTRATEAVRVDIPTRPQAASFGP